MMCHKIQIIYHESHWHQQFFIFTGVSKQPIKIERNKDQFEKLSAKLCKAIHEKSCNLSVL